MSYTCDYYGIFVTVALARLCKRSREMLIFDSHPPTDVKTRDNFRDGLKLGRSYEWLQQLLTPTSTQLRRQNKKFLLFYQYQQCVFLTIIATWLEQLGNGNLAQMKKLVGHPEITGLIYEKFLLISQPS